MVLNMYNKKKKLRECAPTFVFSVSPTKKWHFSRRIPHIYLNYPNAHAELVLLYKQTHVLDYKIPKSCHANLCK
ncbi:hypothetical protein TSAR_009015 [Trichomalopsis sarcophagae]|uniref:Uncharacterized protein n=1 Tax=Trichomalopsis sarcophagae TaxID=543379 RepID=A0A232EG16_9HYME|nr:hypothetical protein TSAR_009015 [Trichomalopsis sarcophagae]